MMSDQHKDAERAHCEAVAREAFERAEALLRQVKAKRPSMVMQSTNDYVSEHLIADLIERERAAAREQGRAEALEEFEHVVRIQVQDMRLFDRMLGAIRAISRSGGSNG